MCCYFELSWHVCNFKLVWCSHAVRFHDVWTYSLTIFNYSIIHLCKQKIENEPAHETNKWKYIWTRVRERRRGDRETNKKRIAQQNNIKWAQKKLKYIKTINLQPSERCNGDQSCIYKAPQPQNRTDKMHTEKCKIAIKSEFHFIFLIFFWPRFFIFAQIQAITWISGILHGSNQ